MYYTVMLQEPYLDGISYVQLYSSRQKVSYITTYVLLFHYATHVLAMLRFRPMDNLSEGEKTVTAFALLFAIHR